MAIGEHLSRLLLGRIFWDCSLGISPHRWVLIVVEEGPEEVFGGGGSSFESKENERVIVCLIGFIIRPFQRDVS